MSAKPDYTQNIENRGVECSDRRAFMRRVGVGTAAAGAVTVGGTGAFPEYSPVGTVQAVPPAAIGVGVLGMATANWLLYQYEASAAESADSGMSGDALEYHTWTTTRTRGSTNASTHIDNINLIDGVEDNAYDDGKMAAIEALNDGESKDDILNAAHNAVDIYETTIVKNLLESWNESVKEWNNLYEAIDSHSELDSDPNTGLLRPYPEDDYDDWEINTWYNPVTTSIGLADGADLNLEQLKFGGEDVSLSDGGGASWNGDDPMEYYMDPVNGWSSDHPPADETDDVFVKVVTEHGEHNYLHVGEWKNLYDELISTFDSVRDGLSVWLDGVYDDVQSGELEIEDLLTSREWAEMYSDDEEYPQAIADLYALNVAMAESGMRYVIEYGDVELEGVLGYTGDDFTAEVGNTYIPDNHDGSFYFTYDQSLGVGEWSEYDSGIDGGEITFTETPHTGVEYHIETNYDETAVVTYDDFESENGTYVTDVSDQLDNTISTIESVVYYADEEHTDWAVIQLQESFTVLELYDSDGNETDSAEFSRIEPHTDDNYITQDEWDKRYDDMEDLIADYEDSGGSGWSDFDWDGFSLFGVPGEIVVLIGAIIVVMLASD